MKDGRKDESKELRRRNGRKKGRKGRRIIKRKTCEGFLMKDKNIKKWTE